MESSINILSIDWDYFIDATSAQRFELFPDGGNEELALGIQHFIWLSRYADSRIKRELNQTDISLEDISLLQTEIDELIDLVCDFSKEGLQIRVFESHKNIADMIDEYHRQNNTGVNVFNIDFHHDCYNHQGPLDCGNWLSTMKDDGRVVNATWVKREDSEIGDDNDEDGHIDAKCTSIEGLRESFESNGGIDAIFICRSACWSPPHLDLDFFELVSKIGDLLGCYDSVLSDIGTMMFRWTDEAKKRIDEQADMTRELYKNIEAQD